jgi:antitoxin ParD1/3/4
MIDFEENFPMNVSLTRELDKFVAAKVASGRYTSASEVVREGLRLLEEQDHIRTVRLQEFNRELKRRLESADRGNFVTADESLRRIRERSAQRRKRIA